MTRHGLVLFALLLSACGSSDGEGGSSGDAGRGGAESGGAGGTAAGGGGAAGAGAVGGSGGAGATGGARAAGGGGAACAPAGSTEEAVRLYGDAWNEPDADARLCLLRRSLIEDATYVDPTIDTTTVEALSDAIGEFQTQFPEGSIEMRSGLDLRDTDLRFAWDFLNAGASVVLGEDYVEIAEDGRLASIRGYWDPYPDPEPQAALDAYVAAWTEADATAREASLGEALATDAQLSGPDGLEATGASAISAAMGALGATAVSVEGVQLYPKFVRARLTLSLPDGSTTSVTDYAHLDEGGKLTRIGRFEGDFPALP